MARHKKIKPSEKAFSHTIWSVIILFAVLVYIIDKGIIGFIVALVIAFLMAPRFYELYSRASGGKKSEKHN